MGRKGMNMVLGALIALMVLLAAAALITFGFGTNYQGVMSIVSDNTNSSDINLCENNVERYCRNNPGKDWTQVYEDCAKYSDRIYEDTDCKE